MLVTGLSIFISIIARSFKHIFGVLIKLMTFKMQELKQANEPRRRAVLRGDGQKREMSKTKSWPDNVSRLKYSGHEHTRSIRETFL